MNAEILLEAVQQITSWGILTTDANLRITSVNSWFEDNCHRPSGEMLGRPLVEVFPEVPARRLDERYRQVLAGNVAILSQRLHGYLFAMSSAIDGKQTRPMQQGVRIAPLLDGGHVVGTLTLVEDVTERVEFEENLRANARQQEIVADLAQRALAGANNRSLLLNDLSRAIADALRIRYCGVFELQAATQSLLLRAGVGWTDEELNRAEIDAGPDSLGEEMFATTGPLVISDATEGPPSRPALFDQHAIISGVNVAIRSGDGFFGSLGVYSSETIVFQMDDLHFLEAAANIVGIALERIRLEEALQLRIGQLAAADKRKNEFLAMLAHELRNPLAPIQSAIQILGIKGCSDEESQWARDVIGRQVMQMTHLINDLLDMSRISSGKINLTMATVELAKVVEGAIEISRPIIEMNRHSIRVEVAPSPVFLKGDSTRLVQVFSNILNNAAKYTPPGGRIELSATQENDQAVLRIRDSGIGIPADMLPHIFDLFTQVERSLDRSDGGLGIGLTLVRSLVEMHGGTVQAHSEGSGGGSEFVVRLPALSPPVIQSDTIGGGQSTDRDTVSHRILVVEDNVDSANSLAMLLRMTGNAVTIAYCGAEALDKASREIPDIVFLDIGLPGLTGLDVAKILRKDEKLKSCHLIALSGYGQDEDRERSSAAGFDDHLVKPVTLDQLTQVLAGRPLARLSQIETSP